MSSPSDLPAPDLPITELLHAHRDGDPKAFDRLVELVYDDLRRIARQQRGGPAGTLETSALVHEAYLKLSKSEPAWADRGHFYAVAARAMRQIFVDHARARQRVKRGGGLERVAFNEAFDAPADDGIETTLLVDDVLQRLQQSEPRLVQVVECRFFAGFAEDETAQILDLSVRTVQRDWRRARRYLRSSLEGDAGVS